MIQLLPSGSFRHVRVGKMFSIIQHTKCSHSRRDKVLWKDSGISPSTFSYPFVHHSFTEHLHVMIWSTMLGVQQGTRRAWLLLWSSWRWPSNRRDWGLTDNLTKQVNSNVRNSTNGKVDDPIKYLVVRKKWHLRRNPEGWIGLCSGVQAEGTECSDTVRQNRSRHISGDWEGPLSWGGYWDQGW